MYLIYMLINPLLSAIFPPSLKALGRIETIKYSEAYEKALEKHRPEIKAGVGATTTYAVRYPNNVEMEEVAA